MVDTLPMENIEAQILPIIFIVFTGFIVINLALNLCLYSFTRITNLKTLAYYWVSLLVVFAFQGAFQTSHEAITLSFSTSVLPLLIMSSLLFGTIQKKPPFRLYTTLWAAGLIVTPILFRLNLSFAIAAMPLCLAMGFIPLQTGISLVRQKERTPSKLEFFLGLLLFASFIHYINFALFRSGEGNQLWGWTISLAFYQVFSLSLLALIFENHTRSETERLHELVALKTSELSTSLKTKETLFRMVLHDIASPLQGQVLSLARIRRLGLPEQVEKHFSRISGLTAIISEVIEKVRSIEAISSGRFRVERRPVDLSDCIDEMLLIYGDRLSEKNIKLRIENELPPGTHFLADRVIFSTSVLGNLVSNAIKFSLPNTELTLRAYEADGKIMIEVRDRGIGIPDEIALEIFQGSRYSTRSGTQGEAGTGFGLTQAKAYMEYFGGKIDLESKSIDVSPTDHGTQVRLTLEKSLADLQ